MAYTAQMWTDGDTGLPISAARLGVIEAGLVNAPAPRGGTPVACARPAPGRALRPGLTSTEAPGDGQSRPAFHSDKRRSRVVALDRLHRSATRRRLDHGPARVLLDGARDGPGIRGGHRKAVAGLADPLPQDAQAFAARVADTGDYRQGRHYASMVIDGGDLQVLSRSGDHRALDAHNGNLITRLL